MSLVANRASAALRLLAQDPVELGLRVGAKLRPQWAWQRYARHCRHQGLARSAVVLSLDCDTHKDIVVAREVHDRLGSIGFCPVYAVPGELLRAGADTYASIAGTGATFMNHGYVEHTRLEEASNAYVSTVFYDRMDPGAVRDDVWRGHAVVSEVIGRPPVGFRTPHFGSYARPAQLAILYELLSGLGYRFSSSTPPINALRHGPARAHGP
ncbi:MAG TPA: hypothetical protein VGR90_01610, partial [Acidimicrobiales bacterium]|nr:hypothetical protein [Acidimicrobiales bacterium]